MYPQAQFKKINTKCRQALLRHSFIGLLFGKANFSKASANKVANPGVLRFTNAYLRCLLGSKFNTFP